MNWPRISTDKDGSGISLRPRPWPYRLWVLSVLICVNLWLIFLSSCASKPTDLRTLVPAETLVYLETNDLAAALQPIVDSKPFNEVAKKKPDFSPLKGVQVAVAVTGFETSEEKLTDEHSVGKVQPHFVAVAETHAWQFQTVRFAEQKLGAFVAEIYDSEPTLEKSEKSDGRFFTWTAKDGRKAFALVKGSLIYFGNDETAIDKCLAVARGESDSIAKTGKVPNASPGTLASGYVSTDGVAQIANIVALKFASEAGEESEVQSAIAGILPQLLRKSITDITWTASQTDQGIEDKYQIGMPAEVATVFAETMASTDAADTSVADLLPPDPASVTIYNFKEPQIAWRSVLLVLQKQSDPAVGKLIGAYSSSLFEPYGIRDAEAFLQSTGPTILTMKEDDSGEKLLVVAPIKDRPIVDRPKVEVALDAETPHFSKVSGNAGYVGNSYMYVVKNIYLGDIEDIRACDRRSEDLSRRDLQVEQRLGVIKGSIVTIGNDRTIASNVASIFDLNKADAASGFDRYRTETIFTKSGMERRTVSDFGLIGSIIAQLADQ